MSVGAKSVGPANHRSRRDVLRLGGSLLAAGAGAPLLGSCARAPQQGGGSDGDGGNEFRLYWNAGHVYDAYADVIKQFEKEHGIRVIWQKFQWPDMRTKLLADFQSGNVPDLAEDPNAWGTEFAVTGNVMSLRPYIDEDGAGMGYPDDWQQATVDRYTVDGEVYGIQLHLTCQLIFYNKQMFADASISKPPTTWEEFLATAQELTRGSVYGCQLNQDMSYSWPWLLQAGGTYYDGSELMTPRGAAEEALQFQQDLVHKHKVSPVPVVTSDYSAPRKAMAAKQAAMIFTGPWDIAPLQEAAPDLDFGVAQALTRDTQATIAAGTGAFIPKQARHPDLAWDLIKRFTTLETELKVTEEAGQTMPRKSWAEEPQIASDPLVKAFAQGLTYAEDWADKMNRTGKRGAVDELYKTLYQDVVIRQQPVNVTLQTFLDQATQTLEG